MPDWTYRVLLIVIPVATGLVFAGLVIGALALGASHAYFFLPF